MPLRSERITAFAGAHRRGAPQRRCSKDEVACEERCGREPSAKEHHARGLCASTGSVRVPRKQEAYPLRRKRLGLENLR